MLDSSRRLRMDETPTAIPADNLYARLGTAAAPIVLDIRRPDDFSEVDDLVVSAVPCDITGRQWIDILPTGKPVVVYCGDGEAVSRNAAATLRAAAIDAAYLEGGFAAWEKRGLPTRRRFSTRGHTWVTRERPKIDRIACPWLIQRFIDPLARFLYVPTGDVRAAAVKTGAVPFDIEGVEFAHEGDRCSFDTLLRIYAIKDTALDRLAAIVRGADTSRHDLAPQCGGLFAISLGLSANFPNDHEMLAHGMVMYDALYTWCRSLQSETHNWPAKTPAPVAS
jgi:rhodanese-related sulfurtransferase